MSAAKGFSLDELHAERQTTDRVPSEDLRRMLEQPISFSTKERDIILQTCCGGASKEEATQLLSIAEARGLNPIKGECYFVKRNQYNEATQRYEERWAVQASIDSFRIKADETGLYDGQDEPEYEYDKSGALSLARVRVWRKGIARPFVGVARFDEYVQTKKDGSPTRFWKKMPHNQLAKCAEGLAFRKAFPARFAKVYTPEEMQQADPPPHDPETGEIRTQAPGDYSLLEMHANRLGSAVTLDELRQAIEAVRADSERMSREATDQLKKLSHKRKAEIVERQIVGSDLSPDEQEKLRAAEANAKAKREAPPAEREPGSDDV